MLVAVYHDATPVEIPKIRELTMAYDAKIITKPKTAHVIVSFPLVTCFGSPCDVIHSTPPYTNIKSANDPTIESAAEITRAKINRTSVSPSGLMSATEAAEATAGKLARSGMPRNSRIFFINRLLSGEYVRRCSGGSIIHRGFKMHRLNLPARWRG